MNKAQRPVPKEWRQIIDGQRPSGLTVAAYCRDRGIKDSAFCAWKRRPRSPAKPNRLSKPAFIEVKPSSLSAAGAIEICLQGKRRLLVRRGFDHDLLIDLPTLASLDHSASTRIWPATAPADMRCGFDRLSELAQVVTN